MDSGTLVRLLVNGTDADIQKVIGDASFAKLCNEPLTNGQYPIHAVAEQGCASGVEALLQGGVNVNQESEQLGHTLGFTAAHYAAASNSTTVLAVLKRYDANFDYPAADKWTPLHVATFRGRSEAVETLVQFGADVNCADHEGRTPLVFAANLGRVREVRFLIQHNASIHFQEPRSDTLLHYALHYRLARSLKGKYSLPECQLDVAVLLVINGVRPDEPNADGDKATQYLAESLPSLHKTLDLLFDNAIKILCAPTELNYLTLVKATPAFLMEKVGLEAPQALTLQETLTALEKERHDFTATRNAANKGAGPVSHPELPAGHPQVPRHMMSLSSGDPSEGRCPFLAKIAKEQHQHEERISREGDRPHCPFSLHTIRQNRGTLVLVGCAFLIGYLWGQRRSPLDVLSP